MTKKYTSLEHTIRKIHDKKQIDEARPLGVAAAVGRGILQAGKWVVKNPIKSAIGAEILTGGKDGGSGQQASSPVSYKPEPIIQPVRVSVSNIDPVSKSRKKKTNEEVQLEQSVGISSGKFKGVPDAFMEPNPIIKPKESDEDQERTTQHAKFHSGKRKEAKMDTSSTMQGKVTEETDRKEVEYVSRPDTAKSPKDKKSKLGRQSAILTRIIDEEKTLVEFFNVTLKKRKEKKKKETETESGQTQVVFNPKLKTAIQEESLVSKTTRIASKAAPWAKTVGKFIPGIQTGLGLLGAGYSASQGDYKGAALSLGSAIPGPIGWGFTGADITRSILSPEEKKDNKPATGATPAPKPEPPKSAATSPPAPPTPSSSSATPTPTPKPEPERNKIPNVGQKYDPISGKPFGGTDSQAKGVTNPLVPPSDLTKPSDMGGYSDKQIVKSPSYSEPEKPPSVETKPQPQSQPVQQPKPQSRQPQMSKPSQPEPKSDWATQELQKYREGRSGVFGQGGYESGGPSKIKAKDHVLKAFMQSKK